MFRAQVICLLFCCHNVGSTQKGQVYAKSLNVHTRRKEVRSQRITETEVIQSVVAALLLFKNEAIELMKQLPLRENYRVVT